MKYAPLFFSGSNDPKNLWPQPIVNNAGFLEKQQVAQYLHDQVCAGEISITDAQEKIRKDWHAVWHEIQQKNGKEKS